MKQGIIAVAAVALVAATGVPHKVVRKTSALEFSYVWPAEAVAIPALDTRFYKDAKAMLAEAQKDAAEDQASARDDKRDFNPHFLSVAWKTSGQTRRLLALETENSSFTGGAHPNTAYGALLWDRQANRAVPVASLFTRSADLSGITRPTYCTGLDAERAKRRGGEKLDLAEFNDCPKFSDLAISPVDGNRNGRFDRIDFVASPYTAGPYVEGAYEISVPVTARLIAALRPEFRGSFEPQRQ